MIVNKEGFTHESVLEKETRERWVEAFKRCPVSEDEYFQNLGLFLNAKDIARILFANNLYNQILDIPGVIMEFGVKWGGSCLFFHH